ncbi:MAG: hypothetical protein CXT73_04650, partial [Methanobacteriota archaeon]
MFDDSFKQYISDSYYLNKFNPRMFFILFVIFFIIDFFFIKYILGPIFQDNIKNIQGTKLDLKYLPAALSSLLTAFTLYYFIILENKSSTEAAILGFLIYCIFESTNIAILKKWSIKAFVSDTICGT